MSAYHSADSEAYVIAATLAYADVRREATAMLDPEDFFGETHRQIFAAVCAAGEDAAHLSGEINPRELGLDATSLDTARTYLASAPARSQWKEHAETVSRNAITNSYAAALEAALGQVDAERPHEAIAGHMEAIEGILSGGHATGAKPLANAAEEVARRAREAKKHEGIVGIRTGFGKIDRYLGGLQRGRNYVVGARAGAGKSTFATTVALNAARQGARVLVQSTEMSAADYLERMARIQAGISDSAWTGAYYGAGEVDAALEVISALDIHVDDYAGATPEMLRRNLIRLKPDLAVVDYLQRMGLPKERQGRSEYEDVSRLSLEVDRLKTLYNVPLLTVVQLNRQAEHRAGNMPHIGDLRGSGQLEQDANVILLLHRPSQYSEEAEEDLMQVLCPKNRHGAQDWGVNLYRSGGGYLSEGRGRESA